MRAFQTCVAACLLVIGGAGCGEESATEPSAVGKALAAEAEEYLHDHIGGSAAEGMGPEYWATSVRALMCNVVYRFPDDSLAPSPDVVVLGRVIDVQAGHAYSGGDGDHERETDFDDSKALWKTFIASFEVEEQYPGCDKRFHYAKGETLQIEFAMNGSGDYDLVREGLLGQPRSIYFLSVPHSRDPAYPEITNPIYRVMRLQTLIVEVDDSGQLTVPFVDERESPDMLGELKTLDDFTSEAAEDAVVREYGDITPMK